MSQYFIDLSDQNSEFDWTKLNTEIIGVINKGIQSDNFKDPTFLGHLDKARELDLYYGEYIYFNPEVSAGDQATYYFSRGLDFTHTKTLNPIIDFENGPWDAYVAANKGAVEANLRELVNLLKTGSGRSNVSIYTYKGFWVPTFGSTLFSDCNLWVASYQTAQPGMFGGWKDYALWQFSQRGSYANSNDGGDVDWSVLNENFDISNL